MHAVPPSRALRGETSTASPHVTKAAAQSRRASITRRNSLRCTSSATTMRVPILTSPRVDMPTTTVTVTCTQREEVEAMRREDGKRFFGLWWKGPRGEQGAVGSLCEVTGIVSMQDAHLVEAKVVGRVTMEQLLADAPCRSALVQPIVDDDIHVSTASRSPELEAAEAKLWSSFQQFCLAAQGLYQGCMCSWECYVGEHSDEQCDPNPDLTCDPDVRTSLLRWRPGQRRVADGADGGQTDSDTLEDPRRSENFSFAAARALGLPDAVLHELLSCTSTTERLQRLERTLAECTAHLTARSSLNTALESE